MSPYKRLKSFISASEDIDIGNLQGFALQIVGSYMYVCQAFLYRRWSNFFEIRLLTCVSLLDGCVQNRFPIPCSRGQNPSALGGGGQH